MKSRMKTINVFLDDLRPCPKGFRLARTVRECLKLLKSHKIGVLSLDHDLGFGEPSGYEVVKTMVRDNLYAKKIIIHSANPFGRSRMFHLLQAHKPKQVEVLVQPEPLYLTAKNGDGFGRLVEILFGNPPPKG